MTSRIKPAVSSFQVVKLLVIGTYELRFNINQQMFLWAWHLGDFFTLQLNRFRPDMGLQLLRKYHQMWTWVHTFFIFIFQFKIFSSPTSSHNRVRLISQNIVLILAGLVCSFQLTKHYITSYYFMELLLAKEKHGQIFQLP